MNSPLDHPVRGSLFGRLRHLSLGNELARRFQPDVNVFASARDESPEALAALRDLAAPGEELFIFQIPDVPVPQGMEISFHRLGVQMVAQGHLVPPPPLPGPEFEDVPLGEMDAGEMIDLAHLTEPGPFFIRTSSMGDFRGLRVGERLAAMAGTRLCPDGYREVSGMCVHPDFRRLGLARYLTARVTAEIAASGDTPFLHAWQDNEGAIALYHAMGYRFRSTINAVKLARL